MASSGLPFSPVAAARRIPGLLTSLTAGTYQDRYWIERTIQHDSNVSAFERNAPFTIGNAGRNILRLRC